MFPLIAALIGALIGFFSSSNPFTAFICGAFFGLIAWALTGFETGSDSSVPNIPGQNILPKATESPRSKSIPSTTEITPVAEAHHAPNERKSDGNWRNTKIKIALVVTMVLVAANYEKCTETSADRSNRHAEMRNRLQISAGRDAYDGCMKDGGKESDCRARAESATEFAGGKAKVIFPQ
jgi:hypothetical protein